MLVAFVGAVYLIQLTENRCGGSEAEVESGTFEIKNGAWPLFAETRSGQGGGQFGGLNAYNSIHHRIRSV